MVFFNKIY